MRTLHHLFLALAFLLTLRRAEVVKWSELLMPTGLMVDAASDPTLDKE